MTRRFGVTLPFDGVSLSGHGPLVREVAGLGYTDLWTSETSAFDAFSPLAVVATSAPALRLGAAIAPVFTRGPALLAMTAAALADAAPGRFVLGIGSSSRAIVEDWNAGLLERPLSRVRDTLRFLRRALAGERIDEAFDTFAVRGFRLERPPPVPPPIHLAALREGMLRLAAEEADGAILGLLSVDDVKRVVGVLHAAGPAREVVARVAVCPTADAAAARALARRMLAAYLQVPAYARFHDWLGRADELAPMRRAVAAGDRAAARAALPDSLVDALVVHGAPQRCREGLTRFLDAGVTTLVVQLLPHGGETSAALHALAPPW